LTSVLHQLSGSTIDGASYTLDSAGNRTAKVDQLAAVTSNYTYDSIYQLTQAAQGGGTTESYTYDPVGNRTASLGVTSYTTNASNELTATSGASYTYDSNGNTLTKVVSSNTTTYAWDYENRLTSVTLPSSGGTVTFKYDPFGRRIEKSSTAATSIFAYDGDNLIEETNSSGSVVARYSQTENIDEPLAMLRSSATSYYQADGLGSVTSLANGAGTLTQTYSFDSFGKTTPTGSVVNPFQYTGRELDSETGLYYYRARYYDQNSGRFLSEDTIGWSGEDANFYRYASNEPSMFIDPLGNTVYLCHRPLNLVGFFSFLNNHPSLATHTWLKTESKEAGLGPATGTVPGQNAPADLPFVPTAVVDHTGQSKAPNASCTAIPDEDESCVNEQLRLGKPEGGFVPGINDCSTFASDVLNKCDLHPHPLIRGRRLKY
jgi:RHS repeat-associated protein